MSMNELGKRIAFANNSKGFAFTKDEINTKLLLAVSEICEAQEELRDGNEITDIYHLGMVGQYHAGASLSTFPKDQKPEGFAIEIADAIIRLLHICGNFNIDIDAIVELKLAYNATRPMKHGRKF